MIQYEITEGYRIKPTGIECTYYYVTLMNAKHNEKYNMQSSINSTML
jgi:hypothetical protein